MQPGAYPSPGPCYHSTPSPSAQPKVLRLKCTPPPPQQSLRTLALANPCKICPKCWLERSFCSKSRMAGSLAICARNQTFARASNSQSSRLPRLLSQLTAGVGKRWRWHATRSYDICLVPPQPSSPPTGLECNGDLHQSETFLISTFEEKGEAFCRQATYSERSDELPPREISEPGV